MCLWFFRSDSDSDEGVSQAFPTTPSSQVERHESVREDAGSPDTVILDPDDLDAAPVVNETSIRRVVSSSQSFHGDQLPAALGL